MDAIPTKLVTVAASNADIEIEFDVERSGNEDMSVGQALKAEIGEDAHMLTIDSITPCRTSPAADGARTA